MINKSCMQRICYREIINEDPHSFCALHQISYEREPAGIPLFIRSPRRRAPEVEWRVEVGAIAVLSLITNSNLWRVRIALEMPEPH
jgi:hypothetical protein